MSTITLEAGEYVLKVDGKVTIKMSGQVRSKDPSPQPGPVFKNRRVTMVLSNGKLRNLRRKKRPYFCKKGSLYYYGTSVDALTDRPSEYKHIADATEFTQWIMDTTREGSDVSFAAGLFWRNGAPICLAEAEDEARRLAGGGPPMDYCSAQTQIADRKKMKDRSKVDDSFSNFRATDEDANEHGDEAEKALFPEQEEEGADEDEELPSLAEMGERVLKSKVTALTFVPNDHAPPPPKPKTPIPVRRPDPSLPDFVEEQDLTVIGGRKYYVHNDGVNSTTYCVKQVDHEGGTVFEPIRRFEDRVSPDPKKASM